MEWGINQHPREPPSQLTVLLRRGLRDMHSRTYRKLVAKQFSAHFRSAIAIEELPIPTPNSGEILIRNTFAGINAGFDTLLCQGKVPYVNLTPPFDLGVEAVGEVV